MNKTAGFLLFKEVEELDFVGPWEIISTWQKSFDGPQELVIVAETVGMIECAKGLKIIATHDFASCPPLDYLIIPGGWGTRMAISQQEIVLR
jgi:putative intracellular protease/amidase